MQIARLVFHGGVLLSSVFLVSCGVFQSPDRGGKSVAEEIEQTNTAHFLCGQKPLEVNFHADKADVFWQYKSYLLTHAVSASGSFYLGEGLSFWVQGNKAGLAFGNRTEIHCQLFRLES